MCQRNRTTHHVKYALGLSPLHNRSIHCVAKFSTCIQQQQLRKNRSFVDRLLRFTVGVLSTPLLKSNSRARWVTSAHDRAPTIFAEGQHPSTPCGQLLLRTHLPRYSQTHCPTIFSCIRTAHTCKNISGAIQILGRTWKTKMRGRPDGLLGVAQIMLCMCENSTVKVPATVAQYPFFFLTVIGCCHNGKHGR